ncbi:MAG: restriction endonuclease subunit S [Anaerolineaceae bacterium]|nr:restriction endonuclease subunit S [Anaerolineaceae bacterium]
MCFINSLSQIGKLCLYKDIGRSAIYTTNLFRIQLKQPYSPNFGYYIFSAPFFQKEIDLITKPAVNQASFTKADFLRILIPIPPKEEREKIVEILESVNYSLETAQIQLRTIQKLKRGLMQDHLTGRVRVKFDGDATS